MRVIELKVDGQRLKLTTDQNIARAIEVGDLKPSTRVIVRDNDEEVFVGPAIEAPGLLDLFPAHMRPVTPQNAHAEIEAAIEAVVEAVTEAVENLNPENKAEDEGKAPLAPPAPAPSVPLTPQSVRIEPQPAPRPQPEPLNRHVEWVRAEHQRQQARAALNRPRPFRHWLARVIDLPIILILSILLAAPVAEANGWSGSWEWILMVPLIAVMVEAGMMRMFGTTAGKALLNIQIRKSGENLRFVAALWRSVQAVVVGAGLWIPVLSLFTLFAARNRTFELGRTPWDHSADNEVYYGPVGVVRWLLILIIIMAYLAFGRLGSPA